MGNAGIYGQRRNKTIIETKEPTKEIKKVPVGNVMAHRRRKLK